MKDWLACRVYGFANAGFRPAIVLLALTQVERLEQRGHVVDLLARGRRGTADEVEYPAVLQPVIGEPPHLAVLVEIDRDHALIDDLVVHERDRTLGALRNVVEDFAIEGCDRGWCSHHDQDLILARPDGNLLERTRRQDVAFLKLLAAAAQCRAYQGDRGGGAQTAPVRRQAARRACLTEVNHSGTGSIPLHR